MKNFLLEIVTPQGVAYEGNAVQLSVRAIDGSLSVLADHIPMVTALKSAPCRVYLDASTVKEADCSGGILSVEKEKVCLLCSSFVFKE
ncbi:MAG: hypothetical protein IJX08_08025 [Clostridia bacterium]|nr:hypothetical protein [Clostridia bacterium]